MSRDLRRGALVVALALSALSACRTSPEEYRAAASDPELLHGAVDQVTEAMMESVTSPPVAARTYAYSSVAAYEALRQGTPDAPSFAGRLNGLAPAPEPQPGVEYLPSLAGINAFLTVAEKLVFEPGHVVAYREELSRRMRRSGVPRSVLAASLEQGAAVGRHVLAWADKDGLKAARAAARLEVVREPGRWVPTAPAYMDAVEPNWGTLRPFVLDSAGQVPAPPHAPFDLTPGSAFYRQVQEVYETSRNLTEEQRAIAGFWDCNPFKVETQGHMMSAVKKISPGGHWMGITAIATRRNNADLLQTAHAYSRVAVTLSDGFINAWGEKYRSVRVRPETVIQRLIDPRWQPLLQTPPFPDYPSGHSVISAAAAEVLTDLFGDGFAFQDDTEVRFGLPVRSFQSFRQAAEEAAMSRMYGGIHYRDSNENGLVMGRGVGRIVVQRLGAHAPVRTASK